MAQTNDAKNDARTSDEPHQERRILAPLAGSAFGNRPVSRDALERRAARLRPRLGAARARLHLACREVALAERVLLARQLEREEAALRLARLADMLECLERALDVK